jgi:hypothetical protein
MLGLDAAAGNIPVSGFVVDAVKQPFADPRVVGRKLNELRFSSTVRDFSFMIAFILSDR